MGSWERRYDDVRYGNGTITFCDLSATMRTSWKSYIPRATSYSWSTSTRRRAYFIPSSADTLSVPTSFGAPSLLWDGPSGNEES